MRAIRPPFSRAVMLPAAFAMAAGCSVLSPTSPGADEDPPVGRFELVAVNDTVLPYTFHLFVSVPDGREERGEIVAGELDLRPDGRYTRRVELLWSFGGVPRESDEHQESGTYAVQGPQIVLNPDEGEPLTGSLSTGEVRIDFQANGDAGAPPLTYVFRL
jgi:hypothetical protein